MNKKNIFFPLICGIILLSASCSYKPQLTSIPLLEKKGDFQIDGTLSHVTISASLTASYAITDHFAAQIFGDVGANDMSYGQGAIGYFKPFNNRLIFENYSGFGYGYSEYYNDAKPSSTKGNYYLGFTQFNLGKKHRTRFMYLDYGAGIKIGYLLHDVTMYKTILYDGEWTSVRLPYKKISSTVIEPNAFIRLGGEHLKFSVQWNFCFLHQWNHREERLFYNIFNLGFGISYRFSTHKKTEQ